MNKKEFSPTNFRRYLERPDNLKNRDYEDYSKKLNEELFEQKKHVIEKTNPKMASTLCSRTGTNFFPRKTARQGRYASTNAFGLGKFIVLNRANVKSYFFSLILSNIYKQK